MRMRYVEPSHIDSGTELGHRYLSDFAQVEQFYAEDYRRPEHLAALASRLINRTWKPRFDRKATAAALEDFAEGHPTHQAVRRNIERLRDPACVCVVTGQQAGLGGGPLYTLYKAVTAIRLARDVEAASGQPCVPVFWNASDDSDVEEVNRLRAVGEDGELRKFRFRIPAGKRPVREIVLPAHDDPQWEDAVSVLGGGGYRDRAEVLLRDAAGRDFGAAFTRLLFELLGSRGLVVIEPRALTSHPAWRRVLGVEIDRREEHRQMLQRTADRLEGLGLPPGVPITNHLNLFRIVDGERRHVTCQGKRLEVEGVEGDFSKTRLLAMLRDDPAGFTPGVLLRPLVQNAIFPTVAYVGGMAEIAYHGLLRSLHRSAQVFMPVLFPRLSMTLVGQEDASRFDDMLVFRRTLEWRQQEAGIAQEGARTAVSRALNELKEGLGDLNRPLENELGKLEQRLQRATGDVMNRVRHDALALLSGGPEMKPLLDRYFPGGRPQERAVSLLAMYARLGPGLVEMCEAAGDVFDARHRLLTVGQA
jgi:bacillithiol synthase